jgi:hypothetical protein
MNAFNGAADDMSRVLAPLTLSKPHAAGCCGTCVLRASSADQCVPYIELQIAAWPMADGRFFDVSSPCHIDLAARGHSLGEAFEIVAQVHTPRSCEAHCSIEEAESVRWCATSRQLVIERVAFQSVAFMR